MANSTAGTHLPAAPKILILGARVPLAVIIAQAGGNFGQACPDRHRGPCPARDFVPVLFDSKIAKPASIPRQLPIPLSRFARFPLDAAALFCCSSPDSGGSDDHAHR
jgi:hypothetical protein